MEQILDCYFKTVTCTYIGGWTTRMHCLLNKGGQKHTNMWKVKNKEIATWKIIVLLSMESCSSVGGLQAHVALK